VPRDTVNLPHAATVENVAAIYRQAWKWGLKGVTVFRYGSKGEQVFERNTLPCLLGKRDGSDSGIPCRLMSDRKW
jgi:ribonucleoside-diphosphate reductase alpha chain